MIATFLYINQRRTDTPIEAIIGPISIIEGTIAKRLVAEIAAWRGVVYAIDNFGGHSSGDSSIIEPVFAVSLEREIADCTKPRTREIEEELKEAERKLVNAVKELDEAIDKEVESILQRLPEWKREADLKKIKEMVPLTKKDSAVRIELDPTRKDSAVGSE